MSTPKHFAEKLLQIRALQVNLQNPYTWASGWRSPVYCDNRKVLSHPYVRDFVKSELANMVLEHFPEADAIAGVATAGIAHGALAADLQKLPFLYVRSKPKEHGMGNLIEGELTPGHKVVVVEDLISTGKSSLEVVEVLRANGAEVIGMIGLFTYGFPDADAAFAKAGVPLKTISNYPALIEVAKEQNLVSEDQLATLAEWRSVFEDFLSTKKQCNETTEGLTFEKFQTTLRKNRDALLQRHGTKRVKFSVYVKEGKAALKATPLKE